MARGSHVKVIMPSNPDYAAAKNLFNTRFDDSKPAAVVTPHSSADVHRAVEFAARNDGSQYFGANPERLVAVRQKYDPAGLMYSGM